MSESMISLHNLVEAARPASLVFGSPQLAALHNMTEKPPVLPYPHPAFIPVSMPNGTIKPVAIPASFSRHGKFHPARHQRHPIPAGRPGGRRSYGDAAGEPRTAEQVRWLCGARRTLLPSNGETSGGVRVGRTGGGSGCSCSVLASEYFAFTGLEGRTFTMPTR